MSKEPDSWQDVMAHHGRSFYLASLFFPKDVFTRVSSLYALCRWIDDAADEAPSIEASKKELHRLMEDLHSPQPQLVPNLMYKEIQLDVGYMEDLVAGARTDLNLVRVRDQDELIQYCYKVAGAVGLAMNDLMKVGAKEARPFAVDLGIAMQLTNICRDIKADASNGRIYIPETLLEKHNISPAAILDFSVSEDALSKVTLEMLDLADTYYRSAEKAFVFIPWRMRGAVIIASSLYSGIGHKLRRLGARPLRGRVYLTSAEKAIKLLGALTRWGLSFLKRPDRYHQKELHSGLSPWKSLRGFTS